MSVSGKYLTVYIGGTELAGNYAWTVHQGGDKLDRTVGSDLGKSRTDVGVEDTTISLKLYLDIATGQPSLVRRGTTLSDLELFRSVDDTNPAYLFPEAIVTDRTEGGEVRGKLEVTVEVMAQGDYEEHDAG